MTQHAETRLALLLDIVTLEYLENALAQEGLNAICVDTTRGPARVYVLGNGSTRIFLASGFSLYDYRIVNALTLLMINSARGVRDLEAICERALNRVRIYYYPVVNHFAYSRAVITARAFKRSVLDEQGNLVIFDHVALLSKYTQILHQVIASIRPHVVMFVVADRTYGEALRETQVRVFSNNPDVRQRLVNSLSSVNARVLQEGNVRIDSAWMHFALENLSIAGVEIVIPYDDEPVFYIYKLLLDVIERLSSVDIPQEIEDKCLENSKTLTTTLEKEQVEELARILKMHGIEIVQTDNNRITVKYCKNVPLHSLLIEEKLIEKYFRVTVSEEAS